MLRRADLARNDLDGEVLLLAADQAGDTVPTGHGARVGIQFHEGNETVALRKVFVLPAVPTIGARLDLRAEGVEDALTVVGVTVRPVVDGRGVRHECDTEKFFVERPRPRHANGVNRAGLADEVVHRFEIPRADADRVVDIIFDAMVAALARGERIELRGFGTFRLRCRRARKARDPKTGALLDVPARLMPLFKPGKEVKAMLARSEL